MKAESHRRWGLAALLIAAGTSAACAQFNHAQPNSPVALSAVPAISPAPRVALVLGSGGPRGYEDGDESLPVAVRAARQAGAKFVIAVDVTARPGNAPDGTSAARLEREARRRARIDPGLQHADFVIHPDMGFATRPTPAFFRMARQSGEMEALRLLPQLKVALQHSQKF
ncbi:hypothetical protein [Limnohabitans sp. Rim8]|uniref:hypothetical protein n=1 Tax=Limnohabitans sp. Rim8 TaxID=1100718 RepID=UPI0026081051|nr:hypothetical protein [Limnohabitans sp. Rim8]